jgi:hypothetical protein
VTTATTLSTAQREPELPGQTVVVTGGSAGIGLETAQRARRPRPVTPLSPHPDGPAIVAS